MDRMWPRLDLRVGDADRQQVVAELQRHYIEGRLTSDELGERVAQATSSRTFADLAATLADLPPPKEAPHKRASAWATSVLGMPLGTLLIVLGVLTILVLTVVQQTGHIAFFPIWPLFIWGFFFIGRPGRRSQ